MDLVVKMACQTCPLWYVCLETLRTVSSELLWRPMAIWEMDTPLPVVYTVPAWLPGTPASKVMLDGASEPTGAWGINLRQHFSTNKPSDQFLGFQLPLSYHSTLPRMPAWEETMLAVSYVGQDLQVKIRLLTRLERCCSHWSENGDSIHPPGLQEDLQNH